jgi:aspartyl-tRNA(Asn)/glutamyl-tRNA(Gln) amidotransferase subunit C
MAVHVDAAMVRQVAKLAKLSLTEAELPGVAADLERVLALVAVLDEVDVTGVAPLLHPHELAMQPRPDVMQPGLTQAQALMNAPAQDEGCFLTPRVIG